MQRRSNLMYTAGALAGFFVLACAAGGVRPSYSPFEGAYVDTVGANPADVVQELVSRVSAEGFSVQWSSPQEGYLETQWYDIVNRVSGGRNTGSPENVVLLRFWADSIAPGRTKVTAEAVYLRESDPSVLPRDAEALVPRTHGGWTMMRMAIEGAKERFGS